MYLEYSFLTYVFLFTGIISLIVGARLLLLGSTSIAYQFGLSEFFIGLTVVSIGTSIPEFAVNLIASFNNENDIAIGNILGRNIVNLLLITGVSALLTDVPIQKNIVKKSLPFSTFILLILLLLVKLNLFSIPNAVGRFEGFVLITLFLFYFISKYKVSKTEDFPYKVRNQRLLLLNIFLISVGVSGLYFGGKFIVYNARSIGQYFELSESFIGLTIIALGTSFPVLVTSIIAASKKNYGILIGNIIGSNIFNVLFILGASSIISPINFSMNNYQDILLSAFSGILLLIIIKLGKWELGFAKGVILIFSYLGYLLFLFSREGLL